SLSLPQSIGEEVRLLDALKGLEDSFELELELTPAAKTTRGGLVLSNEMGDELPIYLDLEKERITMDRTKSGLKDFGTKATPHDRESNDWRDRD
ncbi:GH32 C-terminal domain-containing protein, partial [Porphyromonas sp.]|uniref:GH32 C-terminal domain-containing protein n=1 Tax=Porphyromonas sp. TaxID=1924944 RepID=UPI00257EC850